MSLVAVPLALVDVAVAVLQLAHAGGLVLAPRAAAKWEGCVGDV